MIDEAVIEHMGETAVEVTNTIQAVLARQALQFEEPETAMAAGCALSIVMLQELLDINSDNPELLIEYAGEFVKSMVASSNQSIVGLGGLGELLTIDEDEPVN